MPTPKKSSTSASRANKSVGKPMPSLKPSTPPKGPPVPVTAGDKAPKKGVKAPEKGGKGPTEPQLALPEGGWRVIPAQPPVKTLEEAVQRGLIHDTRWAELVNGQIILFNPPTHAHEDAKATLHVALDDSGRSQPPGRGPRGRWLIAQEVDRVYSDGLIHRCDLAGWWIPDGFTNRRTVLERVQTMYPHWIGEILSPSTRKDDLGSRPAAYLSAFVKWYWVVDPEALLVVAFELKDGRYEELVRVSGAVRATIPPFDVEIDLDRVWGGETTPGKPIIRVPDSLPVAAYLPHRHIHG